MPITLVADAGDAAANSYATVAEADAQAVLIVGPSAAAWVVGVDAEAKKKALISATRSIDPLEFIGDRSTDEQALEWPRTGARTLTGRLYASDALPPRLVAATIELAINYLSNAAIEVLNPVVNDKKRIRVEGEVEIEYAVRKAATPLDSFPSMIQRYLLPLLAASVGFDDSIVTPPLMSGSTAHVFSW